MRKLTIFAAVSAAAMAAAAGVSADAAAANPALDQFAGCAVKNYEGAELLATLPGSEEEADVLAAYRARGCAAPSAPAHLVRGAVAEALFKTDFGSIGARPKRNELGVFAVDLAEFAEMDAEAKRRMMLVALGTCVADADPDGATALLQTAAGTAGESQAIAQLTPGFSKCVAQGQELKTAKQEVRAGIAEGAYRSALTVAISDDVVVTADRDPAAVVTCKNQNAAGTRFRRQICLTEAQWKDHERNKELAAREMQRRAMEFREMQDLCALQSRTGANVGFGGNPDFGPGCL